MKYYAMMEKPAGKAAFGVLLFALLLLARDTLITSCLVGFTRSQLLAAGLLGIFGLAFLVVNRRAWKQILLDKRLAFLAISAGLLLVPMVLKRDWQIMYFSILFCLVTAVFFTYFTDVRTVAKYYVVILVGLSLHSLLSLYYLKNLVWAGKLTVPVFYNSEEWGFFNFGLSYVPTWWAWHRNFGIFREPGVYQFFILMGLFLNSYQIEWKRPLVFWGINIILTATMLSTFAIGGLIELGLFAIFLYFDKKWYRSTLGKVLGIGAVLVVAAAFAVILVQTSKPGAEGTVWYIFIDIYVRLFTRSDSLVDRLSAIYTNALLFLENPLVGDTLANVLHGTNHNTSSTLILYAVMGILGGSLNVAAWVALAWEKKRNIFGNLVLLVILFMSFNTQNLVADVFFWLFPFMALTQRLLPKLSLSGRKV